MVVLAGCCHTGAGRRSTLEIAEPASGIVTFYIRTVDLTSRAPDFYVLNIIFPPIFVHKILRVPYVAVVVMYAQYPFPASTLPPTSPPPRPSFPPPLTPIPHKRCCVHAACPRLGRAHICGRVGGNGERHDFGNTNNIIRWTE